MACVTHDICNVHALTHLRKLHHDKTRQVVRSYSMCPWRIIICMFVVIETSVIKADNGQCKHRMEKHFLIWKIRNLLQTQKIFLNKHFIVEIHYFKYSIKYLAWKVRKKVSIKEWVYSCLLWIRKPDTSIVTQTDWNTTPWENL